MQRNNKREGNVEFFGIDFGLKKIEGCTKCGEEYISDEMIEKKEKRAWNYQDILS